jgi:Ca2+-binding RTX toxin-like protein
MVASRPREPRPASPEPYVPHRVHDRERRRVASQPQPSAGRAPRPSLDSLMIGAPLTAALIGVLLTEGEGALGSAAAGATAAGGGAARHGDGEAGPEWHHQTAGARLQPAAHSGLAGQSAASTSGEIFDPVAAGATGTPTGITGGGADGTLMPPGASPAALASSAAPAAGMSVTFALGGPPSDELGLGGNSPADADGAQPGHRIGDVIVGTDGDDVIHGTPHDDNLSGGPGNDTIFGYQGDDLLDGGDGHDQLFGGPGDDSLLGGNGNDGLFGGTGDDALLGGAGADRLLGEAGRDWLDGGAGSDRLDGGSDPDRLLGGAGNDTLITENIHDVPFGGGSGVAVAGNNTLVVQAAFATDLLEETGQARATFTFSENLGQTLPTGVAGYTHQVAGDIQNVTLEGTADHDVVGDSRANAIWGNDGDNKLHGKGGDDILHGAGGNDLVRGDAGDDQLHGDSGSDQLFGGSGNDIIHSGAGDDTLYGSGGDDLLYGEAGDDDFVIGLNDSGVDTVFDHEGRNWLTIDGGAGHRIETALAGDQLHVVVDDNVVAVIDDYRGHEDAWAGIDTGAGLRSFDDLIGGQGPALDSAPATAASIVETHDDLLETYLTQPSLHGTAGADQLVGTSGADWLVGAGGDDHLVGGAGNDVMEGGPGSNRLEGGAGEDRYLFKADTGFSTIHDTEGANVAQLDGFASASVKGVVSGKNLMVVANNAHIFTFEDFVGHEQAFAGVQIGDQFIATEEFT